MTKPKLRFPEFTADWIEASFGNYIEEVSDKTKEEDEATLLSCAINGIFLNSELFDHQRGSSNKGYKKIKRDMLILSAQNLHLGNANVNQRFDEGMVSPAYNTYILKNCDVDFMAHWIKRDATNRFFFNATTVGASVCRRNIDWKMLYASKIYFPEITEQKKIATFLNTINSRIESQKKYIEQLDLQLKATTIQIMKQELRFKKDDGSAFPDASGCTIGDIIDFSGGSQPDKKYFVYEEQEGYIRLIQTQDYRTDEHKTYIPIEKARKFCDENDVMIGRYGPPVFQLKRGLAGAYNVALIKATEKDPEKLHKEFMYYILSRNDLFLALDAVSRRSAGQAGVDMELLNNFPVILPSMEEQQKIVTFLKLLEDKLKLENSILENLLLLRKGLYQKLFI